ncbi:helix-turn-helix domain-containing protein [Flaviaesturariibacter aridisoli]|uniref:Helix-turn-helix domain-containing protein n=1 Tax=Flaviaesturariibacter aridisoli TaxID=2545761 RepID=A0A4R4E7V0_9BACT|nr:helix-turn-helix domain-containing protein [Flaviaesturariibacter aridisoli]TCZ74151.1 helix-turn-helix domain-containing protein [Flaviaesturariibacter aridisoli]
MTEPRFHIPQTGPLAEYISLIWEVNAPAGVRETILPRGIVEIIFQFDEPLEGYLPHRDEAVVIPRCFIQGLNTNPIRGYYPGRQHLMGLQLQAHRVRALLGYWPSEFLDCATDLTLVQPRFRALWERLAEAPHFEARLAILQTDLPVLPASDSPRTAELARLLTEGDVSSFQSVDALSREVCYSTRQLGRLSKQLFGLPAETLTGYKKFVESVRALHRPHRSLAGVAYEAGFCDQAHWCRVFKSYSGMTPLEYSRRRSALPFHLF